jgi:cellulose synthase/poly-beta-1,6-N-acetylglucosamine synthase-like glycosyltransferase
VSLVIVAHNEATRIERRLENLLSLNYPRERLQILFASDGSTDGTQERARAYERRGVTVIAFDRQRGKPAVLNELVPKARGEIVVLADARQEFESGALGALVMPLAEPQVGAVSGELNLAASQGKSTAVGEGIGFYWRYEKFIRRNESRVDSTVGATGAIYAIRRDLFEPIPDTTLLDDVLIPMRIARRGYRILFEPGARAHDQVPAETGEEFTRKVRTIAGNFQLFARERWLLNPFQNRLWIQTVSHKGLRLLSPLFLTALFATNLFLLDQPFYRYTLGTQIAFYAAALGGSALLSAWGKTKLLGIPYVFCLLNWATVVAFLRFITDRQQVIWQKSS